MDRHEKIQDYVENAVKEGRTERFYVNTITWMFVTEADGWVSMFRWYEDGWHVTTQALNRDKASELAWKTEPIPVPMSPLIWQKAILGLQFTHSRREF